MVGKQAARKRAMSGELSIGDLRKMIAGARARGGVSRVNPAFTLDQALDIYETGLDGRGDDEVPKVLRADPYSRKGRMVPTRDVLMMTNIVRDAS